MRRRDCFVAVCFLLAALSSPAVAADQEFRVTFSEAVRSKPYSGRVYLFFNKRSDIEPRRALDWFHPAPIVALDVVDWKPSSPLSIDASAKGLLAFPKELAELDLAGYRVQALARFNPLERNVGIGLEAGAGAGNGFSPAADVPAAGRPLELTIDRLIESRPFPENRWFKELSMKSRLLSEFSGRDVQMRGAVLLPASYYDAPERHYPVIYDVPGFGGTHIPQFRVPQEPVKEQNEGGIEFLRVTLDPSCPLGHHVFADSANNGPCGTALVAEFIPELDRQFRTVAEPTARFLTGHSSGGWSSLWLQVTHPDFFGGTWSTSPDPVDFRDFQRIDLYRDGENMYRDGEGNRRPLARRKDQVLLWYDEFDHLEELLGPGGQLHSFEAAFSPRGADEKPLRAWDRATGLVDGAVTASWKKFDVRLLVESRWEELSPKLAGKLHVIMGELDTFYLDGATRLLKESLARLGSDAIVELVPGKDHFDLFSPELAQRIRSEMVQRYLKHHPVAK
jgi:hypothetical protein